MKIRISLFAGSNSPRGILGSMRLEVLGMALASLYVSCWNIRGCLITYVKTQVGVFLLKLHIMKREHSGGYETDE